MKQKSVFFSLLLLLALYTFTSCTPSVKAEPQPVTGNTDSLAVTSITWDATEHNFGEVAATDSVRYRFTFTNTGNAPLKIENVKPSCGCTAPKWSDGTIPPGGKGFVSAALLPKSAGVFKKSITVTANTDPRNHILGLNGEAID